MPFRSIFFCSLLICSVVLPSHATEISQELSQEISRLQVRAGQDASRDQVAQVLKELNEHLQQTPNDYAALFLKARLLAKMDQTAGAEDIYRQLIKLNPVRPEAYNNLASILVADNDLAGAQALLEQALKADPSYAAVYENLSHIYVAMARDSYGKALSLKSGESQLELIELAGLSAQAVHTPDAKAQTDVVSSTSDSTQASVELTLTDKDTPVTTSSQPVSQPAILARNEDEIITTLEGWAAAWSEQAADVYFVFYSEDYHPPGKSRRSWEQDRRLRLKKPSWIRIGLKDIEVEPINTKEARVELTQVYQASNYQDMTKKEMKLRQTSDGWRIIAERSISN